MNLFSLLDSPMKLIILICSRWFCTITKRRNASKTCFALQHFVFLSLLHWNGWWNVPWSSGIRLSVDLLWSGWHVYLHFFGRYGKKKKTLKPYYFQYTFLSVCPYFYLSVFLYTLKPHYIPYIFLSLSVHLSIFRSVCPCLLLDLLWGSWHVYWHSSSRYG